MARNSANHFLLSSSQYLFLIGKELWKPGVKSFRIHLFFFLSLQKTHYLNVLVSLNRPTISFHFFFAKRVCLSHYNLLLARFEKWKYEFAWGLNLWLAIVAARWIFYDYYTSSTTGLLVTEPASQPADQKQPDRWTDHATTTDCLAQLEGLIGKKVDHFTPGENYSACNDSIRKSAS